MRLWLAGCVTGGLRLGTIDRGAGLDRGRTATGVIDNAYRPRDKMAALYQLWGTLWKCGSNGKPLHQGSQPKKVAAKTPEREFGGNNAL